MPTHLHTIASQACQSNLMARPSPWGKVETCTEIYPGLYRVTTPSHGGVFVDESRRDMIPPYFAAAAFLARRSGVPTSWYEEDCDWAILALVFPGAFPAVDQEMARTILAGFEPYRAALAQWDRRHLP